MVSVIIPSFNRASFLKKAIESVLSQRFQAFELIVIDDGSRDKTEEMVLRYGPRIRYIRQENKGPASARNLGIKKSSRPFIAFLDSDDRWGREKLSLQLDRMQENPSCLISHTQEVWYKNGRVFNQKKRHRKYHGYIFDRCLPLCVVSMSTVMVQRGIFDKVGFFNEDLPCCEDYDFWLRASVGHEFLLIDKPLTLKDGGRPDQLSSIYATGIDRFRIRSILNLLNSSPLKPKQRTLAMHELRKKCRIYGTGCIKHGRIEEGRYYFDLSRGDSNLPYAVPLKKLE